MPLIHCHCTGSC